eukprot:scaffold964_cov261-Pinguiococcus_pyrenoidosus.AAC.23
MWPTYLRSVPSENVDGFSLSLTRLQSRPVDSTSSWSGECTGDRPTDMWKAMRERYQEANMPACLKGLHLFKLQDNALRICIGDRFGNLASYSEGLEAESHQSGAHQRERSAPRLHASRTCSLLRPFRRTNMESVSPYTTRASHLPRQEQTSTKDSQWRLA